MKEAKILIVDDEEPNVLLLRRILQGAGYTNVTSTTDSRKALPLFAEFEPDLILLDLNMPHHDGFQLLELLKEIVLPNDYRPVLVLTADITPRAKQRALAGGAKDFLTKPFDQAEVLLRIRNLIETRFLHVQLQHHNELLEQKVQEALRELKAAQQQVIQQERLHALGLMAAGVAHDFNNALSVILGFSDMALRESQTIPEAAALPEMLTVVVTAATDASKIVSRLREFHRTTNEETKIPVDLNPLVRQAISFTKPKWENQAMERGISITVQMDLQQHLPTVAGDPAELREVLTNMIFNAVDAMPGGGMILLRTHAGMNRVSLEISDSGTGMTEEVRRRCLEPFFTTKGDRGTGLGLAMVYGIVERHGGTIEIESELGKGTKFIFVLPVHTAETAPMRQALARLQYSLNVLVADDQPILCDVVADYLEQDLHTVSKAHDGKEALEKFRDGKFDLVITDQAMPKMNGDQLADAVKQLSPGTPVIMLTGFGSATTKERSKAVDLVLGKPVSRSELRHSLVNVISAAECGAANSAAG